MGHTSKKNHMAGVTHVLPVIKIKSVIANALNLFLPDGIAFNIPSFNFLCPFELQFLHL
jgi:hypothetical protein